MGQMHQINQEALVSDARMEALFEMFDDLHNAATEGQLHTVTSLNKRELVGWLRELMFTAEETISEIERQAVYAEPVIRLVK